MRSKIRLLSTQLIETNILDNMSKNRIEMALAWNYFERSLGMSIFKENDSFTEFEVKSIRLKLISHDIKKGIKRYQAKIYGKRMHKEMLHFLFGSNEVKHEA